MKVSARTEYACIAMLQLAARHGSAEPVRIREIAEDHGISQRFLVQILLQLKGAGLVVSTRGARGGYQLAREPEEISLGEVMALIEGQEPAATASSDAASPSARVLHQAWDEAARRQRAMLDNVTLADLLERMQGSEQGMWYI